MKTVPNQHAQYSIIIIIMVVVVIILYGHKNQVIYFYVVFIEVFGCSEKLYDCSAIGSERREYSLLNVSKAQRILPQAVESLKTF